jgi:hypothetical protein
LTRDYDENLNRYCDEHLLRWPQHAHLVANWRKSISSYLFWALAYELGLHFRKMRALPTAGRFDRSVFEITGYSLTPEEVQRVREQLRHYRTGPAQSAALFILEVLMKSRLTWPLAWVTQYARAARVCLGLK